MNAQLQVHKAQTPPQTLGSAPGRSALTRGRQLLVQPKLVLGPVSDPFEREADRVAARVMRMPAAAPSVEAGPEQISRKCATCQEEEEEKVQPKAAGSATADHAAGPALNVVRDVLNSPGQSLDPGARSFMEPRFGHDFSRVRIHTGEQAARSARSIGALAYTHGPHIVFAKGRYEPGSDRGRELLAHELTHTIQQQSGATLRRATDAGAFGVSADDASDSEPPEQESAGGSALAEEHANAPVSVAAKRDPAIQRTPSTCPPYDGYSAARRTTSSMPFQLLQPKCACGGRSESDGECEECRTKRLSLARKSLGAAVGKSSAHPVPSLVYNVLRNPGQPLDPPTRAFMEPRFGHDFSQVRVHTSVEAAASARAVNAVAYTVGRHIVFEQERYDPRGPSGRHLLAHELAHVVQQGQAPAPERGLAISPAQSNAEHAADRAADAVLQGASTPAVAPASPGLQRQANPDPTTPGTQPDLPQPLLSLQFPLALASFQVPLGGSSGVSSIFRPLSGTNSPLDTLYQPNLGMVLNYSLHSGPTGIELGFGLAQVAGLFGTGSSGLQLTTFFQPTWVFLTWGPHDRNQLSVFIQPSFADVPGSSATSGTTLSLPAGLQYAYTLSESQGRQWQFFAGVTGGYQHTDLSNPPTGTPGSQDAGFIGVSIGFSFNRVFKRYPADRPQPSPPPPQQDPQQSTPQPQPPPQQTEQDPQPQTPQPQPPSPTSSPVPPVPGAMEIFFQLDQPRPGQPSSDLSVLTDVGRANLAPLAQVLTDDPTLRVQLIGAASVEGDPEYNYGLGGRRAEWVASRLGIDPSRVTDPPQNDLRDDCRPLRSGVVTCGAAGADTNPNPRDRRVLVRFSRAAQP